MSIRNIYTAFFFIGLFFFSFNDFEGISFLGEYKKEPGAIFFLIGFVLMFVDVVFKKKILIPYKSIVFKVLIIFLLWCIIATIINLPSLYTNYFKHTSGNIRFVRQYMSLLISTVIFFLFYFGVLSKLSIKEILYKIRRVFLLSLIVAAVYGFLETFVVIFGINFLNPILQLFDYFPFLEVSLDPNGRISSICYEPPFFAIYLITIAGWMFSYILTEKGILKFAPTIVIIILTFYCGSRTGLVVVFFQLFIFISFLYKNKKNRKHIWFGASVITILFSVLLIINGGKIVKMVTEKIETLNFSKNLKSNVSNQSRFGIQYASLMVFKENPIFGVGFGQQPYHSRNHYPGWATRDNYEFSYFYKNSAEPSFPPGYNMYTRVLSETGLIGFFTLLLFIYIVITKTKKIIRNSVNEKQILGHVLLITFAGLFINWAQIDTFRIYGIWISLAILIIIDKKEISE